MKWESTEAATTSVFILWNSSSLSLKAKISVGHTNVLKNKTYLGPYDEQYCYIILNFKPENQQEEICSYFHQFDLKISV